MSSPRIRMTAQAESAAPFYRVQLEELRSVNGSQPRWFGIGVIEGVDARGLKTLGKYFERAQPRKRGAA